MELKRLEDQVTWHEPEPPAPGMGHGGKVDGSRGGMTRSWSCKTPVAKKSTRSTGCTRNGVAGYRGQARRKIFPSILFLDL